MSIRHWILKCYCFLTVNIIVSNHDQSTSLLFFSFITFLLHFSYQSQCVQTPRTTNGMSRKSLEFRLQKYILAFFNNLTVLENKTKSIIISLQTDFFSDFGEGGLI